jgi:hypothetical protein
MLQPNRNKTKRSCLELKMKISSKAQRFEQRSKQTKHNKTLQGRTKSDSPEAHERI